MKRTNDDIEGPVSRSPWLMVFGIVVLIILLVLGVFLLVEAFKTPEGPQDVLDAKRMLSSGLGLIMFSVAVCFFLIRMFRTRATRKGVLKTSPHKPTKRKTTTKRSR